MEDYVSFETAKLLKEKGFNWNTDKQFNLDKIVGDYNITDRSRHPERYLDAPTIQMAMKWLREVHGLHIEIRIANHSISNLVNVIKYYWIIFDAEDAKWKTESTVYTVKAFDKYEEAAEAAIKYCLENLI